MRAAVYCRISRDRKVDGTHTMLGVERQQQDCEELCNSLGWEVAEVFVDNDISATTGRVRPAYKAMLAAVEAGTVDAIVCWHPDRLYRRTVDLEELVKVCDGHRVPIATVNAGAVDLTTPTGRLVAGLLAQVAKYEGEHKSERWRRSWRQRREAGTPPPSGPRMFGWTRDGQVVTAEAAAICRTAEHLLQGGSVLRACRDLDDAGFTTTYGNPWRPAALRKLMQNPRLAGWVTHKGELVTRSTWPTILDEDTFNALQVLLNRKPKRKGYPRVSVLLGLVHCRVCGTALVTGRRSDGTRPRIYRCPPRSEGGGGCVSVSAEPVEKIVEAYAQRRLEDPRIRDALARTQSDGLGARIAGEIASLEARLVALNAALTDGDQSVPEIVSAITEVRGRIEDAQAQLAGLGPVSIPPVNPWPADVDRRRALIALVVAKVEVAQAPRDRSSGTFRPDRVRVVPREEMPM